jgi:hypothetical protein
MIHAVAIRKTQRWYSKIFKLRIALWLFAIAAIALVPWTAWLSHSLPPTHLDRRWSIAWSGLDVGEFVALALTAYLGMRKSGWIIVAASIAGTLLLVDAWFDCLTATAGWEYLGSLLSAVFAELPLSILAFTIAYRTGKDLF